MSKTHQKPPYLPLTGSFIIGVIKLVGLNGASALMLTHQKGAQPSDVKDFCKRHQRGAQPSDVSRRNRYDWPVDF